MTESLSALLQALLLPSLGLGELIVGLIVGLMFLAFALPARLDDAEEGSRSTSTHALSSRRARAG